MNILLVSHGSLGTGIAAAYSMFSQDTSHIHALGLTDEGGVAEFRTKLSEKLNALLETGEVLIIADLKGGTPYNESYVNLLADPERVRLITGMSLPMVIEAGVLIEKGEDLETVCEVAIKAGRDGVWEADPALNVADSEADLFY